MIVFWAVFFSFPELGKPYLKKKKRVRIRPSTITNRIHLQKPEAHHHQQQQTESRYWNEDSKESRRISRSARKETPYRLNLEREDPESLKKLDSNFVRFWDQTGNLDPVISERTERLFVMVWRSQMILSRILNQSNSKAFTRTGFEFLCEILSESSFNLKDLRSQPIKPNQSFRSKNPHDDYELLKSFLRTSAGLKRGISATWAISSAVLRYHHPELWSKLEVQLLNNVKPNYYTTLRSILEKEGHPNLKQVLLPPSQTMTPTLAWGEKRSRFTTSEEETSNKLFIPSSSSHSFNRF